MKRFLTFFLVLLLPACMGGNYGIIKGNVYFNEDIGMYFDFPDRFEPQTFLGIPLFVDRGNGEMIMAMSGKTNQKLREPKPGEFVLIKKKMINGIEFKDAYGEEDGEKMRILICQEDGIYFTLAHKFGKVRPSNWPHGVEQYSDMVLGINTASLTKAPQ